MSEQVWLSLIRASGASTIGESILRLASLAEAAHMQQSLERYHAGDATDGRADGSAPQGVAAVDRSGADHTEVDR
jgi:hypothetical protein